MRAGWGEDSPLAAEVHLRHHWMNRAIAAEKQLRELYVSQQPRFALRDQASAS